MNFFFFLFSPYPSNYIALSFRCTQQSKILLTAVRPSLVVRHRLRRRCHRSFTVNSVHQATCAAVNWNFACNGYYYILGHQLFFEQLKGSNENELRNSEKNVRNGVYLARTTMKGKAR